MCGKAAQVHLVDDQIFDRDIELTVVPPIKIIDERTGAIGVGVVPIVTTRPDIAPADRFGIGVQQDLLGIEAVAGCRVKGSIKAKTVFNLFMIQAKHGHGVNIARAEGIGKGDFDQRHFGASFEEHQCASGGMVGKYRKVYAIRQHCRAKWTWPARSILKAADIEFWFGIHAILAPDIRSKQAHYSQE